MRDWQGWLYVLAVLIPLASFVVQLLGIRVFRRLNAYIATGAIVTSFALAFFGFLSYVVANPGVFSGPHDEPAPAPAPAAEKTAALALAKNQAIQRVALAQGTVESGGLEAEHASTHAPRRVFAGRFDWVLIDKGPNGEEGLSIPLEIRIDNLAAIMFVMVTFIASLIHFYSMGYMKDDPRYPLFFTYLSLFCFSMLALLASANIFMVFMSWELVGVCSYLLIGFWYEEKKNSDAANKAFIVNRIGDVGMLVGLGLIWTHFGTFNIADINQAMSSPTIRDQKVDGRITYASSVSDAEAKTVKVVVPGETSTAGIAAPSTEKKIPYWILVAAGLGIFAGCVGKSAQFPLHVWLPDAMAGPTPVSALIHAATMVAAGVYLVGRFFPLFTDEVLIYIAYTGGITLFIAATIAMTQTDYKKVLAYSTVSQLGYMMLGLGVGGWAAGLFHLLTHAFFKALLFLGAGSVYHSVHTYEMHHLGGLYPKMKTTELTMLAATLAISGVPFFSGFYSKDAILAAALHLATERPAHLLLFLLPTVGAAITAFYMFRLWFLIFDGKPRPIPEAPGHHPHGGVLDEASPDKEHDHHHHHPVDHAHESEPVMSWPLIALAVPTIFIGWTAWFGIPIGEPILENMLAYGEPLAAVEVGAAHWIAMAASLIVATLGIGTAALFYSARWKRFKAHDVVSRFPALHAFLINKWYFDELYDVLFVKPTLALAHLAAKFDQYVIDGFVNGLAFLTEKLSALEGVFDQIAVDGLVNFVGRATYSVGGKSGRWLQTGRLRDYLMFLTLAVVFLFIGVFFWINPSVWGR